MSLSTVQFDLKSLVFTPEEVKSLTGLPEWKIINIYLYGSRVYGTSETDSDYDFIVTANSLNEHREIRNDKYNVHVITPDKFLDELEAYRMVNLECVFAPNFARIQEKVNYLSSFKLDRQKLRRKLLTQSHDSWHKAKMKLNESDIDRGLKSLFHSLRILLFGIQIIEHGEIIDFSEGNYYWQEIIDCGEVEWEPLKTKFLPLKKDLESIFYRESEIHV